MLSAYDAVMRTQVTQIAYPLSRVDLSVCHDGAIDPGCIGVLDRPSLRLIPLDTTLYTGALENNTLFLYRDATPVFSVTENGVWNFPTSVQLIPNEELSSRHLVLDIRENDTVIGRILVATDMNQSVGKTNIRSGILQPNRTYIDDSASYALEASYDTVFDTNHQGYQIVRPSEETQLDESLL